MNNSINLNLRFPKSLRKIAFIGNSLPRHCGIATFTTALHEAFSASFPAMETSIVAMTDHRKKYRYPPAVKLQIQDDAEISYAKAAKFLNTNDTELVCLQHEFGIFGGDSGAYILPLLSSLTVPVVTTLHTVLARPTDSQRKVFAEILNISSSLVVMAEKGRELLREVYHVPASKINVIAHGIPDSPFFDSNHKKKDLGFSGKDVILTYGLLSPNKGIEVIIDALPKIRESRPNVVYLVLGSTHPNLIRAEGEHYRETLKARAIDRGVQDQVIFIDRFVDNETLLDMISMADVYVTPYAGEAQMTSGTLAYSYGLGRAVVSTPYWHAQELLADGSGILVPFGDSNAFAREITALLDDPVKRLALGKRAYMHSRAMTWEMASARYLRLFENTVAERECRTTLADAAE